MSRSHKLKPDKALTREQLILAAINSDQPTVKKAAEKLAFVIEMSHTQEELKKLVKPFEHHIQAVFQRDNEYKRYLFKWCGEEFVVIDENGNSIMAGDGTSSDKEPVLVYVLDRK